LTLTARHWKEDNCPLIAAGLAYYTIVSLVPLLILTLSLSGRVLGPAASLGQLAPSLVGFFGSEIALAIESMIATASRAESGSVTVASVVVLLWVASLIFSHLQRALNLIWEAKPRGGLRGELLNRLMSFAMVVAVGLMFLGFLVLNAGMGVLKTLIGSLAHTMDFLAFWRAVNGVVFMGFLSVLYAVVYKMLPALKLSWRDVWVGALATAALIFTGVSFLGVYFSRVHFWSMFGAAASVMLVLIWVYFSSQIFLFGAEFTWAYAHTLGSRRNDPLS
jgi:membrane protein